MSLDWIYSVIGKNIKPHINYVRNGVYEYIIIYYIVSSIVL